MHTNLIHYAMRLSDLEGAKVLIDTGFYDLNGLSSSGRPPIYEAIHYSNLAAVELLLMNGVKIEFFEENAENIFHWIASKFHPRASLSASKIESIKCDMIDLVLKFIKENDRVINLVDSLNYGGQTPLHLAASNGLFKVMKKLISLGADLNSLNNRGEIPLITYVRNLKEHYKYSDSFIESFIDSIDFLISSGSNLESPECGTTLVELAIFKNNLQLLEYFLSLGLENQLDSDRVRDLLLSYHRRRKIFKSVIEAHSEVLNKPRPIVLDT